MSSNQNIAEAVDNVKVAVANKDNPAIASSLVHLSQVAYAGGFDSDNMINMLEENGIRGGDNFVAFVKKQFDELHASSS